VAVGACFASGDDGAMGSGGAVFEEVDVDEFKHAFGGEGGAVVDELAGSVGGCVGDGFARHLHAAFGDFLGVAEMVEFFLVL